MEILIFGIILVALMVWTSTRIKRSAAEAYEQETIETNGFAIIKPQGFLSPVDIDPSLAYLAYSKDSGAGTAESFRQATAEVRVLRPKNADEIRDEIVKNASEIVSEENGVFGESRFTVIRSHRIRRRVTFHDVDKVFFGHENAYHLKISVIDDLVSDYSVRVQEMLDSFRPAG